MELKDKEYKKPSVTEEVRSYFNIFECGRNLLDRLDVTYQQAFMDIPQDKYYTRMLENIVEMNNRNGEIFSSKVRCTIISFDLSSSITLTFEEEEVISV